MFNRRLRVKRRSMKLLIASLSLVCILLGSVSAVHRQSQNIEALGWLKGCWAGGSGAREVEEQWTKPAGKSMLGLSRTVAEGRTVAYEFIRIVEEEDGTIYYVAKPSNQREARFKLAHLTASEAVFENPEHDFPQRVIYRLEKDGSLFARIEGVSRGKQRGVNFPMKRAKCD